MITSPTDPLHEYEQALSTSLSHLNEQQRDLTLRTAISLAYKCWTKVAATAAPPPPIVPSPPPIIPVRPKAPEPEVLPPPPLSPPVEIQASAAPPPIVKTRTVVVKNRVIAPKQVAKWTDAQFFALTRDTRSCIQRRVSTGESVGDWYDIRHHLLPLYSLAKSVNWPDPRDLSPKRPPICLEIGVRHGISTLALLTAMRETGGKLISVEIDPEWAQDATERVRAFGLTDWWELHIMSSNELHNRLNTKLDLLWIDGAHEEEFVREDFNHYAPRVRQGGFIAMHDYYEKLDPTDPEGPNKDSGVMLVVEDARRTGKYEILTYPWSHGLTQMRVL